MVSRCAKERVGDASVVNSDRKLGSHPSAICRVTPDTISSVHVLHKRRVNATVARASAATIQLQQTLVGKAKEVGVDPLVHGFEDGNVRDTGRRLQLSPLHPGAHNPQDVIVRVVKRKEAGSSLFLRGKRSFHRYPQYILEHF